MCLLFFSPCFLFLCFSLISSSLSACSQSHLITWSFLLQLVAMATARAVYSLIGAWRPRREDSQMRRLHDRQTLRRDTQNACKEKRNKFRTDMHLNNNLKKIYSFHFSAKKDGSLWWMMTKMACLIQAKCYRLTQQLDWIWVNPAANISVLPICKKRFRGNWPAVRVVTHQEDAENFTLHLL